MVAGWLKNDGSGGNGADEFKRVKVGHEEVGGVSDAVGVFVCSEGRVKLRTEDSGIRRELRHVLSPKHKGRQLGKDSAKDDWIAFKDRITLSKDILRQLVLLFYSLGPCGPAARPIWA